jgi:hypothetical protein
MVFIGQQYIHKWDDQDSARAPSSFKASREDGFSALAVAGALAGENENRCGLGELSADANSDPTPSLLSEDIADDMVSLGMSKTIVLFVGISARTSSVAGGLRPPEIVRQPSYVFVSPLEPGRWNVPVMVWY